MVEQVRMVTVRNTVAQYVGLTLADGAYRRQFKGKGAKMIIPFDMLETALAYDEGVQYLFNTGILYIDSMKDKIDLGLEAPETEEPTNIKVLTDSQMSVLLKVKTQEEFVKEANTLSIEQLNNLVQYAVDNEITDMKKADYLKAKTGRDIFAILTRKRQEAEAERAAAAQNSGAEGEFKRV